MYIYIYICVCVCVFKASTVIITAFYLCLENVTVCAYKKIENVIK